jgi:SAM-dependent methyltransferase
MEIDPNWHDGWFEDDWLDLLAPRFPAERTELAVEFLVQQLALEPGSRVLDVACGHGRVALPLARRGIRVTGIDASPRSLALAREAADAEGLDVELVELDMRELDYGAEFDAAINVFSSFGYFDDEADDRRVLEGIARALRPGGALVLDVINPPGLFRVYRANAWEELEDGTVWLQEHEYDQARGRNRAVWTFVRPDGRRTELRHSIRLYTTAELVAMLADAGLELDAAWGGWDGGELGLDAFRQILRARRRPA